MLSLDNERCDRCGARAKHIARKGGRTLLLSFCTHHHKQYRDVLLEQYWTIESDETEQYVAVPV